MNAELKAQSDQIDKVTDKTMDQKARVAKQTKATASCGGRGAKKEAGGSLGDEAIQSIGGGARPVSARMAALKAMQGMM